MLNALLRTRMAALGHWLTGGSRQKQGRSKSKGLLFAALMVYAAVAFFFLFFQLFSSIAAPFAQIGLGWLYFAMYAIMAFALQFVGTVFTAKAQLFEANDNELLLSMPIRPSDILLSRMLMLLIINFALELLVALPAGLAWLQVQPMTVLGLVSFVLLLVALALFSMAVTCLFAWLISLIGSRVRNKSLMTTAFSLLFLLAYFYFVSQMNQYINALATSGELLAGKLGGIAPLYWFGDAIANGNPGALILALVVYAVPFLLACWLLSRSFIRIVTTKRGFAKVKYEEKALKVSSAPKALLQRETARLLASPTYLLNSGLGIVFVLAAAVALVVMRSKVLVFTAMLGMESGVLTALAILAACLIASMILFTAPSISLEGKTLWIIRSLPVSSQEILRAKLQMNLRLALPPMVLLSLAASYVLGLHGTGLVCMLLAPSLYVAFMGNIGLMANLKHPSLHWTNEAQAVKQGIALLIAMLVGWVVVLVPGGLYLALLSEAVSAETFMLAYTVLLALGTRLSDRWLMTKGVQLLEQLG